MRNLILSNASVEDLDSIADYTLKQHGAEALDRYLKLIDTALLLIAEDPEHPNIRSSLKGLSKFHLSAAKNEAGRTGDKVQDPRHIVFFRFSVDEVEVVRILHDSMDFLQHLPD